MKSGVCAETFCCKTLLDISRISMKKYWLRPPSLPSMQEIRKEFSVSSLTEQLCTGWGGSEKGKYEKWIISRYKIVKIRSLFEQRIFVFYEIKTHINILIINNQCNLEANWPYFFKLNKYSLSKTFLCNK